MGIRALFLVAALTCAPGVALAQAVPPPKAPRVGPPVDYAGEGTRRTPVVPAEGPTIGPPPSGPAVPRPRSETMLEGMSAAEKQALASGVAGSTATLVDEGAKYLADRYKHVRGTTEVVTDLAHGADLLNKTAAVGSAISNYQAAEEKCGKAGVTLADCYQASLNAGASMASLAEAFPRGAPTPAVGLTGAQALQVTADAAGAINNCSGKWGTDAYNPFECATSVSDTVISFTQNYAGAGGKVVGATYSIAKSVLPAAVDELGYKLMGKSWGEAIYDNWFGNDDKAAMDAASRAQAAKLEQMRAQRRAAYQQTANALAAKQQSYDAEQRAIAERQAQAAEAQARAQVEAANAIATQQAVNNMVAQFQQAFAPPPPPASTSGGDSSDGEDGEATDGGCGGLGPGTCR